jgi:hypothetical protein
LLFKPIFIFSGVIMKQKLVLLLLASAVLLAPACWRRRSCGPCGPAVYPCDPCAPGVVAAPGEVVETVAPAENAYSHGYNAEEGVANVSYAQKGEAPTQNEEFEDEDFENDLDLK